MDKTAIDYSRYNFTRTELLKHLLMGMGYFFVMGMIFYQSVPLSIIAAMGTVFYVKEQRRALMKKRKEQLLLQFREAMYALGSSLSAGRSVEQAFMQSYNDLKIIFEEDMDIIVEWQEIVQKISMNMTIEEALIDFAERAGVEDIHNFVSVFVMGRRSGGDLVHIIRETSQLINEKIEIQKEIDILVTQKKFEQQILSYIIPGMILFFTLTSPNFLAPLYVGISGRSIMTLALALYMISGRIGRRIVEIEV